MYNVCRDFKTDIIVFMCNVVMCLMSHWQIIFSLLILTIAFGEMFKLPIKFTVILYNWALAVLCIKTSLFDISFSPTCDVIGGQLVCTNCSQGYTGIRCER